MATTIISSGQVFSGSLGSGDVAIVLSGGQAVNATVSNGGLLVLSGGAATGTELTGGSAGQGSMTILAGGVASNTGIGVATESFNDLSGGGIEIVSSGGLAIGTNVGSGGALVVSAGGSSISAAAEAGFGYDAGPDGDSFGSVGYNGAGIVIASGGFATGTLLIAEAETVLGGGVDSGAAVDAAGRQYVYGSALAATVNVGNQTVQSGGFASGSLISGQASPADPGWFFVAAGGSATAITVRGTASAAVNGAVTGLFLSSGGSVVLASGGITTSTLVNNGGSETISSGSFTSSTSVGSGGTENISSGGTAVGTVIASGGTQNVFYSGTATGTVAAPGATVDVLSNTVVNPGVTSSGVTVSANQDLIVSSGGAITATTVSRGGNILLANGATETGTVLLGGGSATVSGLDSGTTILGSASASTIVQALEMVVSGGVAVGDFVSAGGMLNVSSGGTVSLTFVGGGVNPGNFGGSILVSSGAAAVGTTVRNQGGVQELAGATATGTVISSGGSEVLYGGSASGSVVSSGGQLQVTTGQETGAVVSSGGSLGVGDNFQSGLADGEVVNTVLLDGAAAELQGGTAVGTIVSSGATLSVTVDFNQLEFAGGYFHGVTSGTQILSGGLVDYNFFGSSIGDTLDAGGTISAGIASLLSGTVVSGTVVFDEDFGSGVQIFSGGVASVTDLAQTMATAVLSGGVVFVSTSGMDTSALVSSGGIVDILSTGSAILDVVLVGGLVSVASGGTAISPVISGGTFVLDAGADISGPTTYSGNTSATSPGSAIFANAAGGTLVAAVSQLGGVTISGFAPGDTIELLGLSSGGTASLGANNVLTLPNGAGVIDLDPAQSFAGDQFTLSAAAFGGQAAEALTVVSPNAPPTITSDVASPATGDDGVGQALSFTLITSDAVTVTGAPTLTLNDGGMAAYDAAASTPTSLLFDATVAAGQNAATLAVTGVSLPSGAAIQDGDGNAAALGGANASFTGLQVDTTAPVVASPTLTVAENGPATAIGITAPSDSGSTPSQLTITAATLPGDGTVTLADGVTVVTAGQALTAAQLAGLLFTPTPGQFGSSSTFTYGVADPANNRSTGTATLAVGTASGNPTVSSPTLTVARNAAATAIGIAAPTDPNYAASQLAVTVATLPTDGGVALADGTAIAAGQALTTAQLTGLTFTPTVGQVGVSSTLSYQVADPANNASTGLVTLTIAASAGNPVVSSPNLTVAEYGPAVAIGITAPTDPNYAATQLTIAAQTLPTDGAVLLADGVTPVAAGQVLTTAQLTGLLFKPAAGQFGVNSAFTYSVADPANNASTGTATLGIGPAIGDPVASPAFLAASENSPATAIGIAAPTDPNYASTQLTVTPLDLPGNGTVLLPDGVTPVTAGQALTVAQLIGLLFKPDPGQFDTSSALTYSVADPANNAATGTATLAIGPAVGDPAVSSPAVTVAENGAATAIGINAPTDPNYAAAQLTITAGALPTDGTVSLATGAAVAAGQVLSSAQLTGLLFTPAANQFGQSSTFTYSVADPASNISTGTAGLSIGPAMGAPATMAGALTVAARQGATALGIAAPSDPNYPTSRLTATVAALPTDGVIDLADGVTPITLNQVLSVAQLTSLTFMATSGASSTQSVFGYTVADPALNSAPGTFTLAVGPGSAVAAPKLTTANLITNTVTPTVEGTAVPGSAVSLLSNGVAVGSAMANSATGAFSITSSRPLALGSDMLTAIAATAGGTSTASSPINLFVLPPPVDGVSTPDNGTLDIATLLGQGFTLQLTPGTEAVQLLDGTLSVGPDTNEASLARLYQGLLGRAPDAAAGFADDQLATGVTAGQIATDFLATPEVQAHFAGLDNATFVATVGQDLLGRALSASDSNGFTNLLATGTSRGVVLAGIANSAESKAHFATATSDVFLPRLTAAAVFQMFETGLVREPDIAGAQFATNEVLQSGLTLQDVAQQISTTTEFLADHANQTNAAYVASLYQAGLGRPADAVGSALTAALNNGLITRGEALYGIATSAEAATYLTRSLA